MKLLQANKPTSLTCAQNIDYDIEWDSDEFIYQVFSDKYWKAAYEQGYTIHNLVPEILVYSRKFDFETVYIARADDFDEVEMF
jgi:hypothetical protein